MEATKIIVTNRTALRKKYGVQLKKVLDLLEKLKKADKQRGIDTSVLFLDQVSGMKKVNGAAVTNPKDEKQNVIAVQKIFKALNPDYLLLFGSGDIVPFIKVKNPISEQFEDSDDEDDDGNTTELDPEDGEYILSDLPYACNVPYTKDYKKYIKNSREIIFRVVGRLPDIESNGNLPYVTRVVNLASQWKSITGSPGKAFVLTTADWNEVTETDAKSLFGTNFELFISKGEKTVKKRGLKQYDFHLINCHGGDGYDAYFNSDDGKALTSHQLNKNVKKGSIVAAECCFGAQLFFDPQEDLPMANHYLEEGAYSFIGSSTSAYGGANGDDPFDADILTTTFLKYVLEGSSSGSALQQARMDFKKSVLGKRNGVEDVFSCKTLLQFYLLGDPSVHYNRSETQPGMAIRKGVKKRRIKSFKKAMQIKTPDITCKKIGDARKTAAEDLKEVLRDFNMEGCPVQTFQITTSAPSATLPARKSIKHAVRKSGPPKVAAPVSSEFIQEVAFKKIKTGDDRKRNTYKALFITKKNGTIIKTKYLESK